MKKKLPIKTITVSDEVMDNLENAFKKFKKEVRENEKKKDDKWYIFFTDKQLKEIFGFTDEELKKMGKNKKKETFVVDI